MAENSLLFFKEICFCGELFHCYWWQRLMILTVLELSLFPPPVLSGPTVEKLSELSFFLLTPAAKAHRFSQAKFDFPLMDILTTLWRIYICPEDGRIFLDSLSVETADYALFHACFFSECLLLLYAFHAIDMQFVWISSNQRTHHLLLGLNLLVFIEKKKNLA